MIEKQLTKSFFYFINGFKEHDIVTFDLFPFITIGNTSRDLSFSIGWLFWEIGILYIKRSTERYY